MTPGKFSFSFRLWQNELRTRHRSLKVHTPVISLPCASIIFFFFFRSVMNRCGEMMEQLLLLQGRTKQNGFSTIYCLWSKRNRTPWKVVECINYFYDANTFRDMYRVIRQQERYAVLHCCWMSIGEILSTPGRLNASLP